LVGLFEQSEPNACGDTFVNEAGTRRQLLRKASSLTENSKRRVIK
jgi:hypothetical protein